MISVKKFQLVMVLILACTYVPALGADPNEVKTELKFEISSEQRQWLIEEGKIGKGPIKPTHVAVFYIAHAQDFPDFSSPGGIKSILSTSAGKALSQEQVDLLPTGDCIRRLGKFGDTVPNHYHFHLYAVSQEDAKKMAEAFIEVWTNRANVKIQPLLSQRQEIQERIAEFKKNLPEKESEAKAIKVKYQELKKATHDFSSDSDAAKEAKETILQMNKMLDTLEIELAGIREKMKTIERFRRGQEPVRNQSNQVNYRLDEMFVEQMVELRGIEARKEAAIAIRKREGEFLDLFSRWTKHENEMLIGRLGSWEINLSKVEDILANPKPGMLPPKVFQNKVTIYPVLVEE